MRLPSSMSIRRQRGKNQPGKDEEKGRDVHEKEKKGTLGDTGESGGKSSDGSSGPRGGGLRNNQKFFGAKKEGLLAGDQKENKGRQT